MPTTRNINSSVSVAPGTAAADMVISTNSGTINQMIVTAAGTKDLFFYDNSTQSSGVVVGCVPASASVGDYAGGVQWPVANGITAAVAPGTPGVSVNFNELITGP